MDPEQPQLQVYEVGPTTVIGFGGADVLDDLNVVVYRDAIEELLTNNEIKTLAVDLTGVRLIPSGMLGLLASTRRHGVEVHIYNPSEDVREVLSVTNLDKLMGIYDVSVERTSDA